MMSAEALADEENLRAANTTGKWEPLQLLESYSSRLSSMYKFFSGAVPKDMIHAQPAEGVNGYTDEVQIITSKNNFRLDKFALDESTNVTLSA